MHLQSFLTQFLRKLFVVVCLVSAFDAYACASFSAELSRIVELDAGDIRVFSLVDASTVDSGPLSPCSAVFIFHPPSQTLIASHLASFAMGLGEARLNAQFSVASEHFPLTESFVFVTGVSGPLDSTLRRRRSEIL